MAEGSRKARIPRNSDDREKVYIAEVWEPKGWGHLLPAPLKDLSWQELVRQGWDDEATEKYFATARNEGVSIPYEAAKKAVEEFRSKYRKEEKDRKDVLREVIAALVTCARLKHLQEKYRDFVLHEEVKYLARQNDQLRAAVRRCQEIHQIPQDEARDLIDVYLLTLQTP